MDDEYDNYKEADEYDDQQGQVVELMEDISTLMKNYDKVKKEYRAKHKLTKYEKTRIISERSSMLSNNSSPFIEKPEKYSNTYDLALAEFNEGRIPFIIKRKYGNKYEYWKLSDLM